MRKVGEQRILTSMPELALIKCSVNFMSSVDTNRLVPASSWDTSSPELLIQWVQT